MSFMENLKETLGEEFNESVTENGAVGYRTTCKELVDMNFMVSSMRGMSEEEITNKFAKAFYEDKLLAIKWLFFAGDVRGGLGERRLFRICFSYLAGSHPKIAKALLRLIPEYTRWDNLIVLIDTPLIDDVIDIIRYQLREDNTNMKYNQPISLLAKWMPSINSSSKEKRRLALIIIKKLNFSKDSYRKMLSALREYLKVVEIYIAKKEYSNIDYSTVPSRANLIYNNAFLKNDTERRREYLESLQKGKTKINADVLYPHDIVYKYRDYYRIKNYDITLEELWKALPDFVQGDNRTICVADGSGSMLSNTVPKTKISCLDVANSLAIYFAERCSGEFKNTYITFSERPQLVNLTNGNSLKEKLEIASRYNEVANTNIEAVFDLILQTAVNKNMSQEELPNNILILSDMEFDSCVTTTNITDSYCQGFNFFRRINTPNKKLFKTIADKYESYGYKLPRLVFWNIYSRTNTIPVKENGLGVMLVSGFSPSIVKMVLSSELDPFNCLLEQLNCERYDLVEEAVEGII